MAKTRITRTASKIRLMVYRSGFVCPTRIQGTARERRGRWSRSDSCTERTSCALAFSVYPSAGRIRVRSTWTCLAYQAGRPGSPSSVPEERGATPSTGRPPDRHPEGGEPLLEAAHTATALQGDHQTAPPTGRDPWARPWPKGRLSGEGRALPRAQFPASVWPRLGSVPYAPGTTHLLHWAR